MVKQLGFFSLLITLSSCGFISSVWNAKPPARKNVTIESAPLPSFNRVFGEDEQDSSRTLKLWKESITGSFTSIEGKKENFLSPAEVSTLVKKGFIKLDDDPNTSAERALALMELLGFKEEISLNDVKQLFDWLKDNRNEARSFYKTFLSKELNQTSWNSKDLLNVIQFFGSLLNQTGGQSIEPEHMAKLLSPWISNQFPHAKASVGNGIQLAIRFFSSLCGDRVDSKTWNGRKIGVCLSQLSEHFDGTSTAFDFIFGNLNPLQEQKKIIASAHLLPEKVKSWLKDHHHPLFPTTSVSKLAETLEIPPPYAFFDLTAWMPRLNKESSAQGFSPTFFIDLSLVMENWITTTVGVMERESCPLSNWKSCEFQGSYEPADKIYSEEYATLIRGKSLGFVRKIALYDSLAEFMMQKLDASHSGELDDKIKDLINIVIRLLDTNSFAQNVINRAMEKPYDPSSTKNSLESIERQGLSELAAFASNIIPERGKNKRTFLDQLEAQITSSEKNVPYTLDQLGITTFLYLYDLIGSLRDDYLSHYPIPVRVSGPLNYVKRRAVVESIPRILYDHFPLIYNECLNEDFERTCGVIYTTLLPNALEGMDELEAYEMDVVSITSILLTSMMNRCDRNHDDLLSSNLFDGYDEKHCMLTVSTALAKRLINANIVKKNDTAELLMQLIKKVPIVRWAAKKALSKGTIKNIGLWGLPPFSLISRPASLGSVLSLAAEFMDSDKVEAIENDTTGPITNPGEELIYHRQMTEHFLPGKGEAPRAPHVQRNE